MPLGFPDVPATVQPPGANTHAFQRTGFGFAWGAARRQPAGRGRGGDGVHVRGAKDVKLDDTVSQVAVPPAKRQAPFLRPRDTVSEAFLTVMEGRRATSPGSISLDSKIGRISAFSYCPLPLVLIFLQVLSRWGGCVCVLVCMRMCLSLFLPTLSVH